MDDVDVDVDVVDDVVERAIIRAFDDGFESPDVTLVQTRRNMTTNANQELAALASAPGSGTMLAKLGVARAYTAYVNAFYAAKTIGTQNLSLERSASNHVKTAIMVRTKMIHDALFKCFVVVNVTHRKETLIKKVGASTFTLDYTRKTIKFEGTYGSTMLYGFNVGMNGAALDCFWHDDENIVKMDEFHLWEYCTLKLLSDRHVVGGRMVTLSSLFA